MQSIKFSIYVVFRRVIDKQDFSKVKYLFWYADHTQKISVAVVDR